MINRIVFVDLNGRIATINPDGSEMRVLTGERRVFQFPCWSPQSDQIAAVGSNDNGGGLYVLSDKSEINLTYPELYFSHNQLPFYQYWSPDGQRLSFLTTHPQGFGLRIAELAGKSSYLLTIGQPLFWTWTKNPDQLFIHSGFTEADARLTFIGTGGDGWGENIAQPGYFQVPGISQDGRFWAFAAVDAFGSRQLIVKNNETEDKQLFDQKGMLALGWSPVTPLLAFIATDSAEQRPYGPLTLIDAQNRRKQVLIDKNVIAFFWSPDGKKLAYLQLTPSRTIRPATMNEDAYEPTGTMYTNGVVPFTLDFPEEDPLLYLDLHVVDLETKQRRFLTTVAPPLTFLNQFLPFFDQYGLSHSLWSPDSRALVMAHVKGETAVLQHIPINGDAVSEIVEGLMPSWSHL